jgi:hypothetical protein
MSLFRRSNRDIKDSQAQSGSGHGQDLHNRQPDEQKKDRATSDMVMEQWKDIPLSKQKSDGSGERG